MLLCRSNTHPTSKELWLCTPPACRGQNIEGALANQHLFTTLILAGRLVVFPSISTLEVLSHKEFNRLEELESMRFPQ